MMVVQSDTEKMQESPAPASEFSSTNDVEGSNTDSMMPAKSEDARAGFTAKTPSPENDTDSQQRDNENGSNHDGNQEREIRGIKWFLICASLYISALVVGLDTTIAADVQSSVIQAFGHVDQLAWIGAGFPLGSIVVVLPVGMLFTLFNMKWVYVASFVLFELGSAVCGAAPNMDAIIVGRVLAGAGGAGLFLGCLNYFSALTTLSERGLYISLITFCWGTGAVLGPIIGGAFSVSSATWRWAFYINLVIAAATAPVYLFFLPSLHPVTGRTVRQRVVQLDFIGFTLNAAVWITFAMATTMAGGQWPWRDGRTIAMWIVFGVLLIGYVLQQSLCIFTTPKTRSFPAHLLASRTQLLLCIATAGNIMASFCVIYFIPIYFQFVHGDGALVAAVRLLPYIAVNVSTNLAFGHFLPRIQYYMPIYVGSGIMTVLGGGLLVAYLKPSTSEGVIHGLIIILGIGTGATFSTGFAISTIRADPSDVGHAISVQDVCQLGGSVITLVVAGQIFQSRAVSNLEKVLAGHGYSTADIQGAVAGVQSTLFAELTGSLREAATNAITEAMQQTFALVVVGGGLLILAGVSMRFEKLFGDPPVPSANETDEVVAA